MRRTRHSFRNRRESCAKPTLLRFGSLRSAHSVSSSRAATVFGRTSAASAAYIEIMIVRDGWNCCRCYDRAYKRSNRSLRDLSYHDDEGGEFRRVDSRPVHLPVELVKGRHGQFDVEVDGQLEMWRKEGLLANLMSKPWPQDDEVVRAVRAALDSRGS